MTTMCELVCYQTLVWTHEDYDLMYTLGVGFDEKKNFVIQFRSDYCEGGDLCYIDSYRMSFHEAYYLAKRCGLKKITDLSEYFWLKFADRHCKGLADYDDVDDTLRRVLAFLRSRAIRYVRDRENFRKFVYDKNCA